MSTLIERAVKLITPLEGSYNSINKDDNGSVSIGILQWHGNRARDLMKRIFDLDVTYVYRSYIPHSFINEIHQNKSWNKRIFTEDEFYLIRRYLTVEYSIKAQNELIKKDLEVYIKNIMKLGFTNDNIILFLCDIQNQGGKSASDRIGKDTIAKYGTSCTLENVVEIALIDKVFKNYQARRLTVYKNLTGKAYSNEQVVYNLYTVRRGDNLTKISRSYNKSIYEIAHVNNIKNVNMIHVGQILKIPR